MLGLLSTVSGAVGSSAGTLSQIPFTVAGMSADAGGALVGAIVPSPFLAISQVFSMLSSSFSSLVTSPSQLGTSASTNVLPNLIVGLIPNLLPLVSGLTGLVVP